MLHRVSQYCPVGAFALLVGCAPASPPAGDPAVEAPTTAQVIAPSSAATAEPGPSASPVRNATTPAHASSAAGVFTAAPPDLVPPPPEVGPNGERVVHDFNEKDSWRRREPSREQTDALLASFPHPRAAPGSKCDTEYPSVPPKPPSPGRLMPTVSLTNGAFTRVDAKQSAFVIDYCPTGNGQPLTRRLLVFEGSKLELDFEFPDALRAEDVISSVDVDLDGLSELVLTGSVYRPKTSGLTTMTLLKVAPDAPRVLGSWTGIDHCSVLKNPDEEILHRITFVFSKGVPRFSDVATKKHCYYPPAPPPRR